MGASDDTITLATTTNLAAPGYLTIDPYDSGSVEVIKYDVINGNVIGSVGQPLTRGLAGSAGGVAQAHAAGARVISTPTEQVFDDLFTDIEELEAADGSFVKKDGSTPFTAAQTGVDGTAATDLVTKQQMEAADAVVDAVADAAQVSADAAQATANTAVTNAATAQGAIDAHDNSTDGHPLATTSVDGLMSAADKTALDAIDLSAWAPVAASGQILQRSVGTGEVLIESFNITIPASWNTYFVVVHASMALSTSHTVEFYLYFDGSIQNEQRAYGPQYVGMQYHWTGRTATGARSVRVYGKSVSGTATVLTDGQLTCVAYRIS